MKKFQVFALCLLFFCGACAIAPTPPIVPSGPTEAADVLVKYGVGGDALSSAMGPGASTLTDQITQKFGSAVKIIGYYDWTTNITAQINALRPGVKIILTGDSCGASMIPYDAATTSRFIAALIGFQASIYCPTSGFYETVPSNVGLATEIYNPSCPETFGLGCREWQASPPTNLTIIQRPDLHPGIVQDAINDALTTIGQALGTPMTMLKAPRAQASRRLVLRLGQQFHY